MNRLLTGTAVGLLMSMTPALAQDTDLPADEAQTPPAASEETLPSDIAPPEIMLDEPADPAEPIPDRSSEIAPPEDEVMPPLPKASELDEPMDHPQEAIEDSAALDQPIFGAKQETDQWLTSNMIGQSVMNADNEAIGHINDVVTNENGEIAAVLIGVGGFLGIGEKEVAVRYQDLTFNRDEAQNVTVVTPLSSDMLASAPDYERLSEQAVTVGENNSVIEKDEERLPSDPGIN
ncbi:MAG: PRC-barrel domain-containing protein [Methyloceanibacter sp.]|uniref:PRC-barrel domain-containing protein n=1 Tax=Methyloceanibacter sp. TaxID=1965321 RepID=UPI003EDFE18E